MHTVDNAQWCRIVMDRTTRDLVAGLDHARFDVLEISGTRWRVGPFQSYRSQGLPELDICSNTEFQPGYDLVIAEQVLEHTIEPDHAIENIKKLLRPGGYVLVTTPFLIRYHPCPLDLWRWTESGLCHLFRRHDFEVVSSGSWGNVDCLVANLFSWIAYQPAMHNLRNDPNFPLVVWLLGRKAGH